MTCLLGQTWLTRGTLQQNWLLARLITSLENISFGQVVDTMAEGAFVVDASRCIVLRNRATELLTGYSDSEALGEDCSFLQCEGLREFASGSRSCPLHDQSGASAGRQECLLRGHRGEDIPGLKNTCILKDADSQIIGLVETITDLRPLKYLEQQVPAK